MPKEKKVELYQQFVASPEAGINSIITLAAEQGLELTQAEVSELIKTIDVDDEFDDVELDAIALCNLFIDDLQCFAGRTNGLQACCD